MVLFKRTKPLFSSKENMSTLIANDDIRTWRRHQMEAFPRYWPLVRGFHRWPVDSPPKSQWSFDFFIWSVPERTVEQTIESPMFLLSIGPFGTNFSEILTKKPIIIDKVNKFTYVVCKMQPFSCPWYIDKISDSWGSVTFLSQSVSRVKEQNHGRNINIHIFISIEHNIHHKESNRPSQSHYFPLSLLVTEQNKSTTNWYITKA